jgi:hypothetical protein
MSRLGALLLLSAGAALGSYCYLVPPAENETDLAEITRISAAPDRDYRNDVAVRTFSPASPVFRDVIPVATSEAASPSSPAAGTWTTVVSSGQAIVTPVSSSSAGDPETRANLASDLQRELKRAGCYGGEITGIWSAATKRAMAAFVDRANATLPINQPDYVLLALVQSHREIACTAGCPAGQVAAEDGRCMPRAVVAQASKKSKRLEERRLAAARLSGDRLAGDKQQVANAEPEKLPWLVNDNRAPLPERRELPPGMMSIGGPQVEMSVLPPPEAVAIPTPERRPVLLMAQPIDASSAAQTDERSRANAPTVASLSPGADSDGAATDGITDADAVPQAADDVDIKSHKSKSSRHSEERSRRNHYSGGRTRRGDPRPGTMQYSIARALGGIY